MPGETTKDEYLELLRSLAARENRLPRKSDFLADEVNRIKGLFGPWPWALEAAGLKESKQRERKDKNAERRIRASLMKTDNDA